jgi:formylglycine-generating enzyme required for sulfatase activity
MRSAKPEGLGPALHEPVHGGGAWDDNARNTRLSNRYWLAPDSRNFYTGFRCVGE